MTELDKVLLQLSQTQAPDCPSMAMLEDFLDEKGSTEERQSREAHLRGCPACVNRLIELRALAYLEREGEEPPPALINRLQGLVSAHEPIPEPPPPVIERVKEFLSTLREFVWRWTSPRVFGEVVAVSAVVVLLFVVGPLLLRQYPRQGEQGGHSTELTAEVQRMLGALATTGIGSTMLQQQLVSTLEKLPKNLFLEETRGVIDVEVYKKAAPGTVLIVTDKELGSGVVVSAQGEVLTNWHVVQGAERLTVVFKPQRGVDVQEDQAFAASIIMMDQAADLALLKILTPPPNLRVLSLGDIGRVEVGQDVHAIGHPKGEVWTYTTGIISQVRPGYQWKDSDNLLHESTVIQTQTALNPGNSGGPLLNDRAEVIGINSFRGEGEGLNYAVAVDTVKSFLQHARSATAPSASSSLPASYKTETYGANLVGIYVNTTASRPNVWLSRDAAGKAVFARGNKATTQIDTVIKEGPQPKIWVYYFDQDCDGTVDLIGYDTNGDGTVDRYGRPQKPVRIADLAVELVQALRKGIIPYPPHVCQ